MIYLIRHGESTLNEAGILHSFTLNEGPLTRKGRAEAEAVARFLKMSGFNGRVYSSPLLRARETAAFISNNIIIDNRLREVGMGEWEGKRISDIPSFHKYVQDPVNNSPKGGEPVKDVAARIIDFLREVGDDAAIVSHWLPISTAIAIVLGMPLEHVYRIRIHTASISAINKESEPWSIEYINLKPKDLEGVLNRSK